MFYRVISLTVLPACPFHLFWGVFESKKMIRFAVISPWYDEFEFEQCATDDVTFSNSEKSPKISNFEE